MLTTLKKTIETETHFQSALESAAEVINTGDDDIKDAFLDNVEAAIDGAENDPAIANLAESLPETSVDGGVQVTKDEIKKLAEDYIPETISTNASYSTEEDPNNGELSEGSEPAPMDDDEHFFTWVSGDDDDYSTEKDTETGEISEKYISESTSSTDIDDIGELLY